jgi:uncharacterized protein YjaG (DUF416 family)
MQLEFPSIQITSPNWDVLAKLLNNLSLQHQIMFAASICERTLPIYTSIDFLRNFNHKTLPILREALDYIWDFPALGNFDRQKILCLLTNCQNITSEIETYGLCSSVENTAPYSLSCTLELCLTGEVKYLKEVFSSGHGMIWQILDYLMDQEVEVEKKNTWVQKSRQEQYSDIDNDYYMKLEIQKEKDDWQNLSNTPLITSEFVQQFRQAANPSGHGMIEFEE